MRVYAAVCGGRAMVTDVNGPNGCTQAHLEELGPSSWCGARVVQDVLRESLRKKKE